LQNEIRWKVHAPAIAAAVTMREISGGRESQFQLEQTVPAISGGVVT
jgi:hypothetical protein